MIKHAQNLLLRLRPLQLVSYSESFPVHHFHGIETLGQPHHRVPYLAEVDVADVAAAKSVEQAEVLEADAAFLALEPAHGFPGGLVGLVRFGEEGIAGGDRAAAAAEAEVAHPAAAAGVRHRDGGAAAVIVGFITGYGCHDNGLGKTVLLGLDCFLSGFIYI